MLILAVRTWYNGLWYILKSNAIRCSIFFLIVVADLSFYVKEFLARLMNESLEENEGEGRALLVTHSGLTLDERHHPFVFFKARLFQIRNIAG